MASLAFKSFACLALVACIEATSLVVPAFAETSTDAAMKQKLRVMEARLDFLEGRLKEFEKAEAAKKTKDIKDKKSNAGRSMNEAQTAANKNSGSANNTGSSDTSSTTTSAPKVGDASAKTDDSVPQEAFLFRDLSPTLKKGQFEISQEFDYIRANGFLTQARTWESISSVRYGLTNRFELDVSIPYYYSIQDVNILGGKTRGIVQSFGDASVTANYALVTQTPDRPGISVTATAILPAGQTPYTWVSPFEGTPYQDGTSPIDPFHSVQSRGQYGMRGTVLAYKVFDPIVVYGSIGLEYYFPRTFEGAYTVNGGYRSVFNAGVSFAVSDKVTLGGAVTGIFSPNLWVDGVMINTTWQEQYSARVVATLQLADNLYLEPAVGFGLTSDSPNMQLGLTLRKRFEAPKEAKAEPAVKK